MCNKKSCETKFVHKIYNLLVYVKHLRVIACRILTLKYNCNERNDKENKEIKMEAKNKRQLTLFRNLVPVKNKQKEYIVYRNPQGKYEEFIERFCLRAKANNDKRKNQQILENAQSIWKTKSKDNSFIDGYLKLKDGEKPFVR